MTCEVLGYEEGDVSNAPDEWFRRVHAVDLQRMRAALDAHLQGRTEHFESEHRMQGKDGAFRWVLSRGIAVRDGEGKPYRMAGSMTDISLRKAAEEKLLHEAIHDVLTGLPNRALFMDLLGRSVARSKRSCRQTAAPFRGPGFRSLNSALAGAVRRFNECIHE